MTLAVDPEAAAAPIGPDQAWSIRRGVAVGVTTAGCGLLLWGAWLGRERPVRALPVRADVRIWSLVLVAAVAGAAALRVLLVRHLARRPAEEAPPPGKVDQSVILWVMVVLCVLALCGWLGYAGVRGLVVQFDSGFVSPSRVAVAGGAIFTAVGLVLSARRPGRVSVPLVARGHRARPVVAAGVAAGLVIGMTGGEAARANGIGVHATTASAVAPPAVPARVTRQAWSLPVNSGITGAVPAGPGVVIATSAGRVESVDGRTGRERWSYRRDHAAVANVQASPDGWLVAAAFQPAEQLPHSGGDTVLIVFNATTGRIAHQFSVGDFGGFDGPGPVDARLTDSTVIIPTVRLRLQDEPENQLMTLTSYSATTGQRQWSKQLPPSGLGASLDDTAPIADGGLILAGVGDGTSRSVESVDVTSGRLRWRTATDVLSGLQSSPDGSLLTVEVGGHRTVLDGATGRPVGLPAGYTVLNVLDGRRVVLFRGNDRVVVNVARGSVTPGADICEGHVGRLTEAGDAAVDLLGDGDEVATGALCILPPQVGDPLTLEGTGAKAGGLPLNLPVPAPFAVDQPVVLAVPGAVVAFINAADAAKAPSRLLGFS